uniref:G protein-coupled receptor n=1 Tax=Pristionchus pacificus TaxID=54126 RepID=A0A2A6B316_PRIPA|eukprot:PDM60260.1 G protein-coupled receptor [Pristionchus pacificus]
MFGSVVCEHFYHTFSAITTTVSCFSNLLLIYVLAVGPYRYLLLILAVVDVVISLVHFALIPVSSEQFDVDEKSERDVSPSGLIWVALFYQTFVLLAYHYVYRYVMMCNPGGGIILACFIGLLPYDLSRNVFAPIQMEVYNVDLLASNKPGFLGIVYWNINEKGEKVWLLYSLFAIGLVILLFFSTAGIIAWCIFRITGIPCITTYRPVALLFVVPLTGISLEGFGTVFMMSTALFPMLDPYIVIFLISGYRKAFVQMLRNIPRCDYVQKTDACAGGGYLQWTTYVYCDDDEVGNWFIVAEGVIFLLFLFLMLSTSADDFFCPNISTIVNKLCISENLAGVTFMAFGNGAPDVFTSLASVVTSPTPRADLALGGLLGGALFVTLIVLSGVVLVRPFKAAIFSSLRDLTFFLITMGLILLFFLLSDKVEIWQPLLFIGVYAFYVLTVLTTEYVKKRKRRRAEEDARAAAPEITVTLDGETMDTELKVMHRLDALRKSATSISRRSVVISSFTGNAHEIVIEDSEEDGSNDFIISQQETRDKRRHKPSINHIILTGTKGVVSNILGYFAPEFEDEEPSRFQRVKTYFLWPITTLFKLTVPLSAAEWSKPASIKLAVLRITPVEGGPGVHAYAPIVSVMLIVLILLTTTMDQEPRFYKILGLTVISWANCVGDLVSDSSVARQGFPRMAMAAASGGPLFNVLIGFGLPFTIATIKGGDAGVPVGPYRYLLLIFAVVDVLISLVHLALIPVRLIILQLSGKSPSWLSGFRQNPWRNWLVSTFVAGVIFVGGILLCCFMGLLPNEQSRAAFAPVLHEVYNIDLFAPNKPGYLGIIYWTLNDKGEKEWIPWEVFTICCVIVLFFTAALIIIFCILRIVLELSDSNLAPATKRLQKQLFNTLLWQTIIPTITSYMPLAMIFLVPLTGISLDGFGTVLIMSTALFPMLDPYIVIFLISGYRKAFVRILQNLRLPISEAESSVQVTPQMN